MPKIRLSSAVAQSASVAGMLVLLCGCLLTPNTSRNSNTAVLTSMDKCLVVPPAANDRTQMTRIQEFGRKLYLTTAQSFQGPTVYSEDISELKDATSVKNLLLSGSINTAELLTISRAVGCSHLLTCRILLMNGYAPQRVVLELLLLETAGGATVNAVNLDINLRDSGDYVRYQDYVMETHNTMTRMIKSREDVMQTAALSPEMFHSFVCSEAVDALLAPLTPETAESSKKKR